MRSKKLLFLLSFGLFAAFVFFSYLVSKEKFVQLDFDLTVKLQDHLSRRFDLPFSLLSLLGSAEVTGIIWAGFLLYSLLRRYWLAAAALFTFWGGLFLEIFGKLFVYHPGPPFLFYRGVIDFNFPSSYAHTNYSYPSGHLTRTSFLVSALVVYLLLKAPKKFGILPQLGALGFLVAMMVSRVYLGEHWTTDVIGGTLLGTSLGIFTAMTVPLKKKAFSGSNGNLI